MIQNHSFLYSNQSCQTNSVSITNNNYSNQTAKFTYSGRLIFLLIDPAKIRTQSLYTTKGVSSGCGRGPREEKKRRAGTSIKIPVQRL